MQIAIVVFLAFGHTSIAFPIFSDKILWVWKKSLRENPYFNVWPLTMQCLRLVSDPEKTKTIRECEKTLEVESWDATRMSGFGIKGHFFTNDKSNIISHN